MSVWNFEVVEYTTDYTAVVVPLEIVPPASTFIDEMNEIDKRTMLKAILFYLTEIHGIDDLVDIYVCTDNAMSGRLKDLEGFEFVEKYKE